LEANASVISEKASVTEVEAAHKRLTALEQRLTDLEDNHQRLHRHLRRLEEYRRGRPEPSAEEVAAINPLSAAIFDDEPECPTCSEGNLYVSGSFLSKQVVCSNDTCEFSREIDNL
jgi:DNA repair exonuclease SbcCD ATPase subunit